MGLSLNLHTQQYNLSWQDYGLSLITGFSGYSYANRHWELGQKDGNCGHYAIACVQYTPVLGSLAALIERIIVAVSDFFSSPTQQQPEAPKPQVTENQTQSSDPAAQTENIDPTTQTQANKKKYSINPHAKKILCDYQNALKDTKDNKVLTLLNEYKCHARAGTYSPIVNKALQAADFLFVHGAMHVSHVALMVPVMISFYKWIGDERALKLTNKDVIAIQIAALYHDYGRTQEKNDLANDSQVMETVGASACETYLKQQGFSNEEAARAGKAILEKDSKNLSTKDIYCEILQNCDCIAYIRAHDASFNPKYLDITQRLIDLNDDKLKESFNQILDSNKLFLMSIGDSPDESYKPLSEKHKSHPEDFKGRLSLEDKQKYEENPNCFDMMQAKMREFEDLTNW